MSTTTTSTFEVEGMSCSHCVGSVSNEVGAIPGVLAVDVDLAAGTVAVTADSPVDPALVREAVEAAGYEVTS